MRLKNLTVHGFKSFANRTEIPLGQGITGIVGPNGCGKSNVSEAIRWVLGEGNVRVLRGENILDVIFKGSGTAKPAGYAEVMLLVDNEDQSLPVPQGEVTIARRVFRSGDSDFLINNVPCRLKDIRNLFLGTGLGSHGYSVIERGMVDQVLSDNDEQRRLFFEEAAGISRYKLQRREALRKLEGTEQDLLRIDDIVREIEREVRSLARQVGKARKHHRLLGEIRDLEVELALRRFCELDRRRVAGANERDGWTSERESLGLELSRLEADLETGRLKLLERERLLEEARREREDLLGRSASVREEAAVLASKIQGNEQRAQELSRRIVEESAHEASLRERIASRIPEQEELARQREGRQALVREAEKGVAEAEKAFAAAREEAARTAQLRMERLVVRTKESQELEGYLSRIEQQELRTASLSVHRETLGRKTGEIAERIAALEEEIARGAGEIESLASRAAEIEAARAAAEADREASRREKEEASRERASVESRLSLLHEQRERHEGFDSAVRSLLERRGEFHGVLGVAAELVRPERGLPVATVEALLGDALQWVVVEDEEAARQAIERLRAEGQGGVTFFPLRENATESPAGSTDGWDRPPLHAADDRLSPLVRHLAARVCPRESAGAAREGAFGGARAAAPLLRHLSPEGIVYSSEGWIRLQGGGGADREILERMREIPDLEEAAAHLRERQDRAEERLLELERAIAEARERASAIEREKAERIERERRLDRELSERKVERGLLTEEAERVAREIDALGEAIEMLRRERAALEDRLGISEASELEAQQRHDRARAEEDACARRRDTALATLTEHRTEMLRLENAIREIETSRQRDGEEADRLAAALILWGQERDEASRLAVEGTERRQKLLATAVDLEERTHDAEGTVDRRRSERDEEQSVLAALDHEIRERRAVFEGLKERLHDDQIRQVEIRSEMDRLRERILQEFEIDLEVEAPKRLASLEGGDSSVPAPAAVEGAPAAAPAADLEIEVEGEGESEGEGEGEAEGKAEGEGEGERGGEPAVRGPLDPEAARVQIEELRRKLADIGPVNFLASEEYDRQRERLLFHRKQQEDLRKARTDLLQAIAQINETAGRMFLETFETARQNFRATFEFLFPGGEADVALAGEDPLECGIDITARPRGKKLEAIRLLSTGERSLTAIALLFGLYLVKPSPFCMLDELDAPLDDANIGRFVTLLGHHRERTQFIVITHNKRTMEAADRLYGVTMQEPGISKIVSVRLSDVEAEILPVTAGAGGGVEGGTAGPDADAGAGGPERGQP